MTTSASHSHHSSSGMFSSGVANFAGVMLVVVGAFQILEGISAIAKDNVLVSGVQYVYKFDLTAWGWWHLLLGVVSVLVGLAITSGRTVGYLAGIGLAGLSCVTSFMFLPYYPVWSLIVVAFDVLVIWALCSQISHDRITASEADAMGYPQQTETQARVD